MRRISMAARDELVAAIAERYSRADRTERSRVLDEFTAVTGFHRKHAMRLLRAGQPNRRSGPRPGRRTHATRDAMIAIWEASNRICGKRRRPLAPPGPPMLWPLVIREGSGAKAGGGGITVLLPRSAHERRPFLGAGGRVRAMAGVDGAGARPGRGPARARRSSAKRASARSYDRNWVMAM
jgi:hypothetical protein